MKDDMKDDVKDDARAAVEQLRAALDTIRSKTGPGEHPDDRGNSELFAIANNALKRPVSEPPPLLGTLEALTDALAVALFRYELDLPHVANPAVAQELVSTYYGDDRHSLDRLRQWATEPHHGDCTGQPQTCSRCAAEESFHEAHWLAKQLLGDDDATT